MSGFVPLFRNPLTDHFYLIGSPESKGWFGYTSGRCLFNEDIRLRDRHVKFDPDGLFQEVERHLGPGHGYVVRLTKIAGGFSRVFLLTMEDEFVVIVKIPYHITGPKHYATASEAASMQHFYTQGIPVPKLYG